MKVSRELYQEMQNQTAPKTKSYYTIPMAFLIGGFICTLGELLLHLYAFLGADQTAAAAFTSITLIGCSVLFTGLGWYEKIAKHAGAGTLVPITGFTTVEVPAAEASNIVTSMQSTKINGHAVKVKLFEERSNYRSSGGRSGNGRSDRFRRDHAYSSKNNSGSYNRKKRRG